MDYSNHTAELEFQLLLRQKLLCNGASFILELMSVELSALAHFLEENGDPLTDSFQEAANILDEATLKIAILLKE